ncbi:reverse transcriptase [Plakobranchus ocellatus]|uniref:Reverse transcriptase n=1 Tax=Plakobranchus ocellatus TaxID=259542 RepID=A0AAV4C999_9GAST|nr:reverse transcriptase [Plakobranchus ocellatus]
MPKRIWIYKHLCPKGWHSWGFELLGICNNDVGGYQRAKSKKLNLDVVWLDLANAYGSVPREIIQLALRMYHVPEVVQEMLDDYFSGFRMRFSTNDYTINWINLKV